MNLSINIKKAFGKTKTRSQMTLIFTEDGRIVEREIAVLKSCAGDEQLKSGWLLDAGNQVKEEGSGVLFQLLGERSAIPISLIVESKVKDLKNLINKIFHESWVSDLIQLQHETKQNEALTRLYTMLGIPLILGALILGIKVISEMRK